MKENPQKEDGYVGIANEVVEALARTNLSSYESRFLWCLLRKTYGWNKKEDWISLSQIAEITGMHKSHVSRTKKLLLTRRIVTQRGNKIGFNKFYSQWNELPRGVNRHDQLPREVKEVTPIGKAELPDGAYTKDTPTKDTKQNHGDRDAEIVKWFGQKGKKNPRAYLAWLKRQVSDTAIDKAWKEAKRQNIGGVSGFVDRCKETEDGRHRGGQVL